MFKYLSKFRDTKKRDGVCRFFKLSRGSCGYIIACLALIVAYSVSTGAGQMTFARSNGKKQFTHRSSSNNRLTTTPKIPKLPPPKLEPAGKTGKPGNSNGLTVAPKIQKQNPTKLGADGKTAKLSEPGKGSTLKNQRTSHGLSNDKPLPLATQIAKSKTGEIKLSKDEQRRLVSKFFKSVDNLDKSRKANGKKSNKDFLSSTEDLTNKRFNTIYSKQLAEYKKNQAAYKKNPVGKRPYKFNAHSLARHGADVGVDYLIARDIPKASKFINDTTHVGAFLIGRQAGKLNADKGEWSMIVSTDQVTGLTLNKKTGEMYPVRNIKIVGYGQHIRTIHPTDEEEK